MSNQLLGLADAVTRARNELDKLIYNMAQQRAKNTTGEEPIVLGDEVLQALESVIVTEAAKAAYLLETRQPAESREVQWQEMVTLMGGKTDQWSPMENLMRGRRCNNCQFPIDQADGVCARCGAPQ